MGEVNPINKLVQGYLEICRLVVKFYSQFCIEQVPSEGISEAVSHAQIFYHPWKTTLLRSEQLVNERFDS